jgi:hypothetical protein
MTPKNVIEEESKDYGMSDSNSLRGNNPKVRGFMSPKNDDAVSKKSDFDKAVKELGLDNSSS